jgi:hypothetical protein
MHKNTDMTPATEKATNKIGLVWITADTSRTLTEIHTLTDMLTNTVS